MSAENCTVLTVQYQLLFSYMRSVTARGSFIGGLLYSQEGLGMEVPQ